MLLFINVAIYLGYNSLISSIFTSFNFVPGILIGSYKSLYWGYRSTQCKPHITRKCGAIKRGFGICLPTETFLLQSSHWYPHTSAFRLWVQQHHTHLERSFWVMKLSKLGSWNQNGIWFAFRCFTNMAFYNERKIF